MNKKQSKRHRVPLAVGLTALIVLGASTASFGSQSEALYVDTSTCSITIYNEANCHGAPDGLDAYISGPISNNFDIWTFDLVNIPDSSGDFDSANIYITHWVSTHENDVLVWEYFDGTNWNIIETFNATNPPPAVRTTSGPFSADSIKSWSQVDGFQLRLRGVNKVGGSDVVTCYVDAAELRVSYNQAPVLDSIGSRIVDEGQTLEFRVSATDPDLDAVTLTAENVPTNAAFIDSGNGAGSLIFNPDYDQAGVYNVTFIASDGLLADSELVAITVNDVNRPPVLDSIGSKVVDEAQTLEIRVSATDPDLDAVVLLAEDVPTNATFIDSGNGAGSFAFNPAYDQSGVYDVTFIASDGALADSELVAITVNDVNRSPALDSIGSKVVDEAQTLEFRVSATDPDLDAVVLLAENVPTNATFIDSGNGAGSFTFDPDYTQSGVYNVIFIGSDGALADSEAVAITVNDVNRVPVADAGSDQLDIEAGTLVTLDGSGSYDPDGDSIGYHWSQISGTSVTLSDTNTVNPTFTPIVAGSYGFELQVDDGLLMSSPDTVFVSVSNQAPVLDSIGPKGVDEGQALEFRISATDLDGDAVILTAEDIPTNATLVDSGNGAGSFTFNPDYDQAGIYDVTFIASDGSLADSELVAMTVDNVNRSPVLDSIGARLVDEGQTLEFRVSSSDPDGDALTLSAEDIPTNATFIDSGNGAGSFTFNPDYDQAGVYNVTFIASDGSLADSELVAVTVNNVNRSPVLDSIGSKSVDEAQTLEFRVSATDPDLHAITLTAQDVPTNATFVDSGNGAGSFTFNPTYDQAGVYNVTFIASDGALADSELVAITVDNVNRVPVLDSIGARSVDEAQTLEFRVSSSDPDGDALTLSAGDVPTNATFVDSGNGAGSFTFNPDYDQAEVYNVTFIASDGSLADSELVAVTVNNVNRSPVLDSIGSKSVDEAQILEFRVSASDPDGDAVSLSAEDVPANATFIDSGNGAGSFTFNPDYDQAGVYNVTFIASDGLLADSELVAITVNDVNRSPVLDSIGSKSIDEAQTLEFRVSSTDPDGDALTLSAGDVPTNATFIDSGNGAGSFTFNPDYDQAGVYNVTFIASDGSLADSEVVTVTVNDVNRAPIADAGSDQLNVEAGLLVTLDGSGSSDPDGDSIGYHWIQISGLAVTLSDTNAVNPTFTPDIKGNYEFELKVDDGSLVSLPDTVLVSVSNQVPVLDSIGSKTVNEGEILEFRVTATDADGDSIILSAEDVPTNAAFVDSGNGAGSFTFNPDYDQSGVYNVTFIASDGLLADSELVVITVNNVNRSPVLDSIGSKSVDEAQTLEFRVSSSDPDGNALTLSAEDVPTNAVFVDSGNGAGSFTFNPDYTQAGLYNVTFIASDGTLADSELVAVTVNDVNRAPVADAGSDQLNVEAGSLVTLDGSGSYDPDGDSLGYHWIQISGLAVTLSDTNAVNPTFTPDIKGNYEFELKVDDGSLVSLPDTVLVSVSNQVPVLDSIGSKTVNEGEILEFRVTATDADGDSIILSAEDVPTNAAFVDSGNGAGSFTFNPDYDQSGIYNVTFIASDGTLADSQLVVITVNNINRAPALDSIRARSVDEGQTLEFRVSSSDPDGDALTLSAEDVPTNATFVDSGNGAGSFTFNPNYDQSGTYNVTFITSDGTLADSELVAITVNDVNRAPILDSIGAKSVDETQTLEFRLSGTDPDGDALTLTAVDVPTNATFVDSGNGAGSFTFNPDYTQAGPYDVTFISSDGSLADSELVAITVNDVNRAPVLDSIGGKSVDEAQTLEFRVSSTDPDGDALTLTAENVPTNATFIDSGNGAGSFTFNPDYDQAGPYDVTFIASDASLADSESVAITVNDVNRAPVLDSIGARSVDEAQTLEFRVLATDPDLDALTLTAQNVPANAVFVDSGNGAGSFTFNPDYDQVGVYNVTFIVSDGSLADSELVAITVNNINRSPVLDSIGSKSVDEAQTVEFRVSSTDPDGDAVTLTAEDVPTNATFTDSANGAGSFTFNPTYDQAGVYNVTFIASDGSLADSELVVITVNNINRSPVLDSIGARSVDEGQTLEFRVSATDPDLDAIALTAPDVPTNATFVDSGNGAGSFTFNPDHDQAGVYNVTFIASDGSLADSELVAITVNDVNRSPVLDLIGSKSVDEAQTLEFRVSATDPDLDAIALTAQGVPLNATFVDSGNGAGSFTFNPDYDQAGVYNVTFIASDGTLADSELVAITVNDVNRSPVLDPIGSRFVDEGLTLSFRVSSTDPDLDLIILTAETVPLNATFVDSGNGAGSFTFNPDYDQAGVYNVTFIVSDGALADSELVAVTVNDVNRSPVLDSIGSKSVDEAQTLEFRVSATDPDLDAVTLTAQDVPANATFVDSGNGAGSFVFNPDYDQAGAYNVTFIASDGSLADSELVAITVNNVNRAPVADAGSDQSNVEAGTLVTLDGSGSYDPDGDSIGYHWIQISGLAVTLSDTNVVDPTFTPDVKGNYEFELEVDDGLVMSLPDTVLVSVSNQAPVLDSTGAKFVDEGQVLDFRVSATDADGDSIILSAEDIPTNATFVDSGNGAGSFTFNPDYDQAGVYNVTFIVSDGALADSELVAVTVNDVNRSPVLDSIGSKSVDEAQTLEFRVSSSDPDLDAIALTAPDVPTNATFVDSGNGAGSFTFNPTYDQAGVYNVTFIASDGSLADSELVTITVNDVNRSPALDSIGTKSVDEAQTLEFRVSATDPDLDAITLTAQDVPTNAVFVDSGNGAGSFTFNPDYTQSGEYNVTFIASDGLLADSELVAITVNDVNRAPVLDSIGSKSVDEGQILEFRVSSSDPDGDALTLSALDVPANAVFVDSGNGAGSFTFNPDYDQSGVYDVTFIASDGSLPDSELVAIAVNHVNRAPVLDSVGSKVVDEAQTLEFRVSAADPDLDAITLTAEDVPTNATFVDSGNGAGSFTFNPDYDQAGVYNVTFIASDGLLADSEVVAITVNHVNRVPVLDSIGSKVVGEAQTLEFRVWATDPDLDAITLTAEDVPANASFVDSGNGAASFTFNPNYDQAGVYNVTFIASDGSLADSEMVEITVNNTNRAPVLDSVGSRSVIEGGHLAFLVSASDPDGEPLALTAENIPVNSTFSDSGTGKGSFEFDPDYIQSGLYYVTFKASDGDLTDSEVVEITVIEAGNQSPVLDSIGSKTVVEGDTLIFKVHATDPDVTPIPALAAYNRPANSTFVDSGNGNGSFSFYPDFDQSGVYIVTFVATDGSLADTELVEITVTEINRAPVLDSIGSKNVDEGQTLEFRVSATDPDADSVILTAENVPANASFVDSGNGAGSFTFDPDYTQAGIYNVTFIGSDGALADSELVQITVNEAGNQAPVLDSIGSRSVDEDQTLEFRVSASDPDLDSIILTAENVPVNATLVDSGNGAGSFTFDPDYTQAGAYDVTFIASDGALADSEVVSITVNNVNRAPVLDSIGSKVVDEGQTLEFRVSATDPDLDSIILSAEDVPPTNAAFVDSGNGAGSFTFNPDYDQAGVYNVTFISSDGSLADSEAVSITVNDVNRAPVLDSIGAKSVDEAQTLEFRLSATDPDGDALTLTAENVPANATFIDSGNGAGSFTFNPDYTQAGPYNVTFIASDGSLADSESVAITVNDVNRAPVLDSIGAKSVDEAQTLEFRLSATDPDGDALTLTAENVPTNAVFVDSGNGVGSFAFNPDWDQAGVYDVTFIASDGFLADSELVAITVNNVNRSPVLDSIGSKSLDEGKTLEFRVSATDPDLDAITLTVQDVPTNATFVDSGNGAGSFTFNPDYDQAGIYNVTFIASDGSLADSEVVSITVNDVNRAPVLDSIGAKSVNEAQTLEFRVSASDPDLDALALTAENVPVNATFVDSANGAGSFAFNPDYDQAGVYNVTFIASDGSLADSELVGITVNDVNRAPVADAGSNQLNVEAGSLVTLDGSGSYDPDGDSIGYHWVQVSGLAVTLSDTNAVNPTFTPDAKGNYEFELTVDDAILMSLPDSVLVSVSNQAPVLDSIGSKFVDEGQALEFRVGATDGDGDSVILGAENIPTNAAFVDSGNGAGSFSFSPDYEQAGVYNLTFIASDGLLADSEVVAITVNDVNRAPVLDSIGAKSVDEGQTLEFRVSSTDPDLDAITLTAEDVPINATFVDSGNGAGSFTFDPDYTQAGVYGVTFIASDGSLADSELVDITVNHVNQAPVLDSIGSRFVDEGQTLEFKVSATDFDGDALTLTAQDVPTNATFVDSGNGAGSYTFNPSYDQAGVYNVTFIASDGPLADSELVAVTVNDVNRSPVLDSIGSRIVDEGQTLEFRVWAADPDLDALTLTAQDVPVNATFVDSGSGAGSFTFNPDYTQAGIYNVTFMASDGSLADSEIVQITVNESGNQAPVLDSIGSKSMHEAETLEFRVSGADPDLDSIILSAENVPLNASLVDSGNGAGSFAFNADYDQAGVYNVTFVASDGSLADSEIVEITVNNTNRAPVLDSTGSRSVLEGGHLAFVVLASDPDNDTISLSAENLPLNATFVDSNNGDGLFEFDPDYTQSGLYYVIFKASDGDLVDSEVVEITVIEAGNRSPVLDSIGPKIVAEAETLVFKIHATDPDGAPIPALAAYNRPANSAFVDSGNGNGSFSFYPDFDQAGIYTVTFAATDGYLADSEFVEITVTETNRAPVLDSVGSRVVNEGETLEFRTSATDPDADSVILTAENVPANASFVDSGNGAGSFTFNPDYTQAGTYNVTFIASDGALADSELVQITVNEAGNQAPVLDSIGSRSVDEDQTLEFRVSASDPDLDSIILTAENVPVNATFVDSGNGAGSFTFNPDYTQAGAYDVTFIASDGALADSEVVSITVNNVNRAPVLDSTGAKSVDEGQTLEFRVAATDPDLEALTLTAENVPTNATFVDSGNGAGSFTFNPDYDQAGVYDVTFIASDGSLADSELVVITVDHVNRSPVLDSIGARSADEGQTLEFRVSATDPDLDALTLTAENIPTNATFADSGNGAGSFTFNPDYDQAGVYNVTFIASDGPLADSEVVSITINHVNRAPVLDSIGSRSVDEGQTLEFRVSAADPDLDALTLTAENVPTNATFVDSGNGAGSFTFNPTYDQAGAYNVTFIVSDGSLADSELVAITVNHVNRSPVLDSVGARSVDEGKTLEFRVSAADPDLDALTLTAENVPANAAFVDSGNGAGSFTFNSDYDQAGVYNVTFIASDGTLADSELVDITVNHVNQGPVLDSIGSRFVDEGQTLEFKVSATDPDLDALTLTAENVPLNATFTDSGNGAGSFSFVPDYTQSGVYNVTFISSDGSLADSEAVSMTVNEINRAPVADAGTDQPGIEANTLVTLDGSASHDPDGDSITYRWTQVGGPGVTPSDSTMVQPTFTPTVKGTYVFQLIVNDGSLDSQPDSVTVSVDNQPPVADAGPDQSGVKTSALVTLDGSGSYDPDADSLSYDWIQISGPSASLSDSTAVNPTFTPVLTGDYLFELIIGDGIILSQPDTVLINVPAPPQAVPDLAASISGDSVLLSWSAVTSDTSGEPVSVERYVIYRATKAYFAPIPSDSIGYTDSGTMTFTDPGIGGADVVGDLDSNYYYVIKAVDIYGNHSDISNRVGEYDYEILVTSTTDFNYVTLPFTGTGITDAAGLISSIGASNINNVSRFIQSSQSYEARFAAGYGTNFAVVPGGIYQVNAKSYTIWSVAGGIPAVGSISYTIATTPTSDFNFITIPFDDEDIYHTAQDVIDSLPGALNTLNNFKPASQSWESRFAAGYGIDFTVRPGGVYQANAKASASFPPGE